MRWAALLACCAMLSLVVVPDRAAAQSVPAAPTISSVTAAANTLTVSWTAPAGTAAITAYDLRYILTSADETDDANWTLIEDVWATGGGDLQYVVGDLLDGLSYDVQVRAKNSTDDGAWSVTYTASTRDHTSSPTGATPLAMGSSLPGYLSSSNDWDTFEITVPAGGGDLWTYTTGEVDTRGLLATRATRGGQVGFRDLYVSLDGWLPDSIRNFSIRYRYLAAGTYYVVVRSQRGSGGAYRIHAKLTQRPGSTRSTAKTVTLGEPAVGLITLARGVAVNNYFTFTLTESTDVVVIASGSVGIFGELQDSAATTLGSRNGDGFVNQDGFVLRRDLDAGTYYVWVGWKVYNAGGPYILWVSKAGDAGGSSIATATPLKFGHPQVARISSDTEEDYFSFTLDEERYVTFLAQPFGEKFGLEMTLYDGDGMEVNAYTLDREDYGRKGQPHAAGILEKLAAGSYTVRVKAPTGESGGSYVMHSQIDFDRSVLINVCKDFTDKQSDALSDPASGCQWYLKNTNQYGGAGTDVNVESVWEDGNMGAGVNVAVVDGGIHADHEDLRDNVLADRNHDYYGRAPEPFLDHGTQMASLIAARDNDLGIRGVAPRATIYSYNLLAENSKIVENAPDAMTRHMADTAVSNNSWSFGDNGDFHSPTAEWEAAVEQGVTSGFGGKGVFYVWAAGNGRSIGDNSNLDGRANFYAVTAACATSWQDQATESEPGANLWVCAPAGHVRLLFGGSPGIISATNGHRYTANRGGTSHAAALVSGVAALIRAENAELTWRDVKLILAASARRNDSSDSGWRQGALKYGSTTSRYWNSHDYGFGIVDGAGAVTLAKTWDNVPELRTVEAESETTATTIVDAMRDHHARETITSSITVPDGYVEFIEYLEVKVNLNHDSVRDLYIELTSPSGAVSVLTHSISHSQWNRDITHAFDGVFRLGSARHLGEDVGGKWTLRLSDRLVVHHGTFRSWSIKAYGHGLTPGYPPAPTATSGMRTLTIDWDAPTDTGDTAVTGYDLRYIRSSATDKAAANWVVKTAIGTDATGTHALTELGPGAQYDIQVRAVNDAGTGPWSEVLQARPTLEAPFAPTISSISPRDTEVAVVWTAPTEDGGSEITSYDLRYIRSDSTDAEKDVDTNWTPVSSAWVTGDGELLGLTANLINDVQYDVQVRATNGTATGPWSETSKGTPAIQNYAPEFADETATREVREDLAVGGAVGGRVTATNPDTDTLSYAIRGGHTLFVVDATTGQIRTAGPLDYDTTPPPTYSLTIDVSDGKDSNDEADATVDDSIEVTINVTNLDEPPVISGDAAVTREEGTDRVVGAYTADDPENTEITWSLAGADRSYFEIERGVLSFVDPPDYEARTNPAHQVTVQATDEGGEVARLDVIVTLTDLNEPPVISGPTMYQFLEGPGRLLDYYTKRDPEQRSTNWGSVGSSAALGGSDAGDFELIRQRGRLRLKSASDYESGKTRYEVIVFANDGEETGELTVTVDVLNRDEVATLMLAPRQGVVGLPLIATLTEPDGLVSTTWSWFRRTTAGASSPISGATTSSYTPVVADLGHLLRVEARYVDNVSPDRKRRIATTESVTVEARTASNADPVLPGSVAPIEIPEDTRPGASVGSPVLATDADDDLLTYSLSGHAEFVIGVGTGQIAVASGTAFDFEGGTSSYGVTVTASDAYGGTDTVSVTINITNVNEPPTLVNDGATLDEDTSIEIDVLGNDSDPDAGDTLTLLSTLPDRPGHGTAAVDTTTNRITYTPNPNYHGADTFTYQVSDAGSPSLSSTATVSITVANVNDAPTFASATVTRVVSESAGEGDNVGAPVTARDIDEGDTLSYSLSGPTPSPSRSTRTQARSRWARASPSTPPASRSTPSRSKPTTRTAAGRPLT